MRTWPKQFKNFGKIKLATNNLFGIKRTLRTITDSFGSLGGQSKGAKNPKTWSTELQTLSGDIFNPWHVKALSAQGIKGFADLIESITVHGNPVAEKWAPGGQIDGVPHIQEVLVIVWCGNDICVDAGKERTKTAPVTPELLMQIERLSFLASQYQSCIIVWTRTRIRVGS